MPARVVPLMVGILMWGLLIEVSWVELMMMVSSEEQKN
jgi:hypothetical protein